MYAPQADTFLLARALEGLSLPPAARVLDLCTGTGAVALAAARAGAAGVTAVDTSARAVFAARFNARVRRLSVRALRGDLLAPVEGQVFDVMLANPPYVVSPGLPPRGKAHRAWYAGGDGRSVVDRICRHAPGHLAPGGLLLLVHSALCNAPRTLDMLRDGGLKAAVVDRTVEPFGPVMRSHAPHLRERGLIDPEQNSEELVVIRADRPLVP
ncbi:HemK2/MTQ2 family protein methyltransferase [Streptomyces sp. NPDC047108]|uniref:HemK2/MTQ2 family protein methyltransferase n=1 Tax=Streptomyces sp. NPDC047108 TaxID=3155025 RepID=UPI0033E92594